MRRESRAFSGGYIIRPYTHALPFPVVGAGFTPARAAPPGPPGSRSTQPGHGGMWACRPTKFGGGAAEIAGLFGRP